MMSVNPDAIKGNLNPIGIAWSQFFILMISTRIISEVGKGLDAYPSEMLLPRNSMNVDKLVP